MKKSDFGVVTVIYAVILLFFVMTIELPEEAQTYPLALIAALFGLTTLYLVTALLKYWAERRIHNDLPEIFAGFQAKQFFGVIAGCALYLVIMYFAGYYIASTLYLVGGMLFLKVPKKHIAISLVTLMVLIYAVFSLFLKVPLPAGVFFS